MPVSFCDKLFVFQFLKHDGHVVHKNVSNHITCSIIWQIGVFLVIIYGIKVHKISLLQIYQYLKLK